MEIFLKKLFPPVYVWYRKEMITQTANAASILDVGCGFNSYVQFLDKKMYRVGVDLFDPYIEKAKKAGIHNEYFKQDVRSLGNFKDKSFDIVYSSDVIEHLTKEEGLAMLAEMERIAKKRVIVSTPNGHRHQETYDENELQKHNSAWSANEFRKLGFSVVGMDGLRALRADESKIRFRPHRFWSFVANITQFFVYRHPSSAHSLFCVKEVS
jgi:2-polyprenyl-3-methyl-5-hydroxy-6-metoxy-1,4-benzoquinol methylase